MEIKEFIRKLGFGNYIVFLAFLLLTIVVLYMWREVSKFNAITGEKQGFLLVGFITFLLIIAIIGWVWEVYINNFKDKE